MLAGDASDLLNQPSARFLLSHHLHRFLGDVDKAKEVYLHLSTDMLFFQLFQRPREPVTGIVDDDIDAAKRP